MYDVSYREGRQLAEIAAKPEEKARLIKQLIEKKVSEGTMQVAAPPPTMLSTFYLHRLTTLAHRVRDAEYMPAIQYREGQTD